ncbi:hypothetical protein E0Z06_04710 [Rheinheimera sp. D18]|uniref:cytochrome b562 n=1 Tax=Rheinheimera sp. D18 TaxID=2545632 RepID=UPI00104C3DF7|nr:cytochrome b562 [Rheinheimera sp. D18]QBL08860.1 hypothetical protein E0Z06_04710 [Rheinheimera sp. D18]
MRAFCLCLFFFSASVFADTKIDLEKTMKNMAFHYKQAYDTQQTADLVPILTELITLTQQALIAEFAPDKAEQFKQGLDKVLAELQLAKLAAEQDDLAETKSHLRKVDALRKDYHKLRKVSIWDLLFG